MCVPLGKPSSAFCGIVSAWPRCTPVACLYLAASLAGSANNTMLTFIDPSPWVTKQASMSILWFCFFLKLKEESAVAFMQQHLLCVCFLRVWNLFKKPQKRFLVGTHPFPWYSGNYLLCCFKYLDCREAVSPDTTEMCRKPTNEQTPEHRNRWAQPLRGISGFKAKQFSQ